MGSIVGSTEKITGGAKPMKEVEYSQENVAKCWCGQCPVQKESDCAKDRYAKAKEQLAGGAMPEPDQMPGLYCATGKATCPDLNPMERCLCAQCLVWGESGLVSNHFCALGSAQQVHG
ncbi:MAG TPA: DUF2769 domain-containing protein [Coriobacteriia bacterium]|nr:DUF2769 domain-containing protein [Coriobacteriia bacterium]